jgi:hypothetical protein
MAKQKFRPTRLGGFSGAKAYIWYVEVLKKRRNAVGRTFCDAIKFGSLINGDWGKVEIEITEIMGGERLKIWWRI